MRRLKEAATRQGRQLSAAVFSGYPWCGQEVAQRWPRWVDERLLDFIVPMDYSVDEAAYPGHLRSQNDALKAGPLPAIPAHDGGRRETFRRAPAMRLPDERALEQDRGSVEMRGGRGLPLSMRNLPLVSMMFVGGRRATAAVSTRVATSCSQAGRALRRRFGEMDRS